MNDLKITFLIGSYFLNKIFFEQIMTQPENLGYKTEVKINQEVRL